MTRATVLGATGLVGSCLLERLLREPRYEEVHVLARRALPIASERLVSHIVDFERPAANEAACAALGAEQIFCCLGTTMKQAGSRAAFRKVDYEYPLALARIALARGARKLVVVTAVGADAASPLFYNRTKGQLERDLAELAFPGGMTIARPSILLGERTSSRPAERVAAHLMRATRTLFSGPLLRYRAITGDALAAALITAAAVDAPGLRVLEGATLFAAASSP
ncbi:MAG: NAD-dependent epimerase/dehydratase family protein [Myxococcales bacterium]|nr:NAD-dependent epimerase/dehydratase family protein [Myxococcales bacterium]